MGWAEAVAVSGWLYVLHLGLALLGRTNAAPVGAVAVVGLALYLVGSYLNTASEYGRHRWKQQPAHQGRLYTGGLFRYAVHINYFGDAVLFAGFALMTGTAWALVIPVGMTAAFVFAHIPALDRHLKAKYGAEFDAYAETTSTFVPWLY